MSNANVVRVEQPLGVCKDFYLDDMKGLLAWKKAFKTASVVAEFWNCFTSVKVGSTEYQDQLKIYELIRHKQYITSSTSTSAHNVLCFHSCPTATSLSSSSSSGHLSIHQHDPFGRCWRWFKPSSELCSPSGGRLQIWDNHCFSSLEPKIIKYLCHKQTRHLVHLPNSSNGVAYSNMVGGGVASDRIPEWVESKDDSLGVDKTKFLRRPTRIPSKFYYLFLTASKSDSAKFYRELCGSSKSPIRKTQSELLKNFRAMKIEDSEDIQMFFFRLDPARKHIENVNEICNKTMRIEIFNWQIRAKLIEAAECIPKFKHYNDQLKLKDLRDWSNMTHTYGGRYWLFDFRAYTKEKEQCCQQNHLCP